MNKGKIIDIKSKYAVVLNEQMRYEKINKKDGLTLGQEIYYFNEDLYKEKSRSYAKYALVAALFMMVLFIQPLMNQQEVFGYISVDINPSIQLEVNKDLEVLDIESKNVEGDLIVESEWIGQPADVVVDAIIKATQAEGILNESRDFVLVSYYFEDEDFEVEEQWTEKLDALFEKEDQDFEVAVVKANKEDLDDTSDETIGRQSVKVLIKEDVADLMAAKEAIEKEEKVKVYRKKGPKANNQASEKALEENPGKKNEKNPVFGDDDKKPGFDKKKDEIEEGYLNRQEISSIINESYEGNILKITFEDDEEVYIITLNTKGEHREIIINAITGDIIDVEVLDKGRGNNKDSDAEEDDEESIEDDEDIEDEDELDKEDLDDEENNGQNNKKNKNKPENDDDDIDTEDQDDEKSEDADEDTEEDESEALEDEEDEESEGDESPLLTKEQIEEIISEEYMGEIESIEEINGPNFLVTIRNNDEIFEVVLHGVTGKLKENKTEKSNDTSNKQDQDEEERIENDDSVEEDEEDDEKNKKDETEEVNDND